MVQSVIVYDVNDSSSSSTVASIAEDEVTAVEELVGSGEIEKVKVRCYMLFTPDIRLIRDSMRASYFFPT